MTKTNFAVLGAAAFALSLAAAAPASAGQIKKVNRAEGEPATTAPAQPGGERPTDSTGTKFFDKLHDGATAAR